MPEIRLKEVPDDVKAHIIKMQAKKKIEKKIGQYSQESAIYEIIREHAKLTEPDK